MKEGGGEEGELEREGALWLRDDVVYWYFIQ